LLGKYLGDYTKGRNNNFNLLRFVVAYFVLVSHSFSLVTGDSSTEPLKAIFNKSLGEIAVDIFFLTSGFLIIASLLSRNNIIAFVWARFLRIYPGLIVATLLTVFLLGPIVSDLSFVEYFTQFDTIKYLIRNMIILLNLEYNLPGVFLNNPYANTVNGSLWTLPYELKMYLSLLFMSVFFTIFSSKLGRNISVMCFTVITFILLTLQLVNSYFQLFGGEYIRLYTMFFLGVCYFYHKDKIKLSFKFFLLSSILLISTYWFPEMFFLVYTVFMPYIVFYVVYLPKGKILNFNKLGDCSYGLYIYAFPIQQLIIHYYTGASILEVTVYSSIFTLILALISWHFVEKKALSYKNSYTLIEKNISKLKYIKVTGNVN
jgi:peptidoglycan/LPS O-acetylase OafA/YrhL